MNNLLFLPLDIEVPNLIFPELSHIKSNIDGASFWDYEQLLDSTCNDPFPWRKDLDSVRENYKNFISDLPFVSLENVRLSIQSRIVKPHIDVSEKTKNRSLENFYNYQKNEPCGYRIVISGNRSALKLQVKKKYVTAKLPSVPCVYVINSTACRHFVDSDLGRKSVYIRGKIDSHKHVELIEKSLQKYKNYAVYESEVV
jgi:hypothetical protein